MFPLALGGAARIAGLTSRRLLLCPAAIALDGHLEDGRMMHEAVHRGQGHGGIPTARRCRRPVNETCNVTSVMLPPPAIFFEIIRLRVPKRP